MMSISYRSPVLFGLSAFFLASPLLLSAQTLSPNPVSMDTGIVAPVSTGVSDKQDPSALLELKEHLAVVGVDPWRGMQGTGQIVYGPDDPTSYAATLSVMGSRRYRLDAQSSKGETSMRIDGKAGKVKSPSGAMEQLTTEAAEIGIFPFGLVRTKFFAGPQNSLIDQGIVSVEGVRLHRITVETPTVGKNPLTGKSSTMAIDLYFDPSTHLLTKSATSSAIANGHSPKFLRVVTYSDYRKVGAVMVPFKFTESMEGQQYWSLQLSDVQLNPSFDDTYFRF